MEKNLNRDVRFRFNLAERTGFEPTESYKLTLLRALNGAISRIGFFAPICAKNTPYTCSPNDIIIVITLHIFYTIREKKSISFKASFEVRLKALRFSLVYFSLSALASVSQVSGVVKGNKNFYVHSSTHYCYYNNINPLNYLKSTCVCGLAFFKRNFCFVILDNPQSIRKGQIVVSTCATAAVAERLN